MGRSLLQSDRNATLFIEVLRSYVAAKKFWVHDFVIMPDHIHVILTVDPDMTVEKAVQFIKGGFSYRLKKETGYSGEVWQRGFSEARIADDRSLEQHRLYIAENPVKAGLIRNGEDFQYCFTFLNRRKQQGLKPEDAPNGVGTAEAVP